MTSEKKKWPVITVDQWERAGTRLYGDDKLQWQFKCSVCGHVQIPEDFRQYNTGNLPPDIAYQCCIGRFMPDDTVRDAFNGKGKGPCDYSLGGLFRIPGVEILTPDGEPHYAFAFADPIPEDILNDSKMQNVQVCEDR